MEFEKVYQFIIEKLRNELPTYLTYHNFQHTEDVVDACNYLAGKENVVGEDLLLLKTAALFHDTGFLQNYIEHEQISCQFTEKFLPDYGYTDEQIKHICQMIMATRIPQNPQDHLGQILCDSDLFYFGGNDFDKHSNKLFEELKYNGLVKTNEEWNFKQIEFISSHKYFTITANNEREKGKQEIINKLELEIDKSHSKHEKLNKAELIEDSIFIVLGVIFSAIALKCFLVPNHFFDGGVTGISLLISEIFHIPLTTLIIVINLPLILLSYYTIGKQFAYKTLISIALLVVSLLVIPDFVVTHDHLLISIFGGILLGIGSGMVLRIGCALDGMEVLAVYTLKRTSFSISEIIMAINIVIFSVAAFKFGIETSMYSILTYFAAAQTINYVVEGLQAFTGVTIISGKSEEIKYQLVNKLNRGVTVYKGERGFLPGKFEISTECDILFTVITRLELRKLKLLVFEEDPKAFVFANTIKEASGGVTSKRKSH